MNNDLSVNPASTTVNKTGSWRTYIPATDMKTCIGCGTCAKVCPEGCIAMKNKPEGQKPETDYDFCKGCGLCAAECPVKAIKMSLDKK
jgi:2-oxoacid:acceptor oxidoreductase delta subunit (pyruvate/2-ketoisovalerate family)